MLEIFIFVNLDDDSAASSKKCQYFLYRKFRVGVTGRGSQKYSGSRCLHSDAHTNNLAVKLYFKNLLHYILYTVKKIFQGQRNRTVEIEATTVHRSLESQFTLTTAHDTPSTHLTPTSKPKTHIQKNNLFETCGHTKIPM